MAENQKVYLLQLQSIDSISENKEKILQMLRDIPQQDMAALVCLPENALYMRLKEGEKISGMDISDPALVEIEKLAKQKNLLVHVGSIPLKLPQQSRLGNCSVILNSEKNSTQYQKIHLFDIELEGQKPIRESDAFIHGESPAYVDINDWKFGQTICYDLRFSNLFHHYAKNEVDGILVPAAFLKETGIAHWHVLLRARAIESQCYILAAAQAGEHISPSGRRVTYGHSLIIDPWGKVLSEGNPDKPEVLSFDLQKSEISRVRKQIPMRAHRRSLEPSS